MTLCVQVLSGGHAGAGSAGQSSSGYHRQRDVPPRFQTHSKPTKHKYSATRNNATGMLFYNPLTTCGLLNAVLRRKRNHYTMYVQQCTVSLQCYTFTIILIVSTMEYTGYIKHSKMKRPRVAPQYIYAYPLPRLSKQDQQMDTHYLAACRCISLTVYVYVHTCSSCCMRYYSHSIKLEPSLQVTVNKRMYICTCAYKSCITCIYWNLEWRPDNTTDFH